MFRKSSVKIQVQRVKWMLIINLQWLLSRCGSAGPMQVNTCVSKVPLVSVSRLFSTENSQLQKQPQKPVATFPRHFQPAGHRQLSPNATWTPVCRRHLWRPPSIRCPPKICCPTISWLCCHPLLPRRMSPTFHRTPQGCYWQRQVWGVPSALSKTLTRAPGLLAEPGPMFPK